MGLIVHSVKLVSVAKLAQAAVPGGEDAAWSSKNEVSHRVLIGVIVAE